MSPTDDLLLVDASRHKVLMDMPYQELTSQAMPQASTAAAAAAADVACKDTIRRHIGFEHVDSVLKWSPCGYHLTVIAWPHPIIMSFV